MPEKKRDSTLTRLRRYFISGLIIFLPAALTVYLLIWVLTFADSLLGKHIQPFFYKNFGFYIRGAGILLLVYLIVLIGFFASNFLGKKLHSTLEKIVLQLPFFRQVYPALKEMALFIFSREKLAFNQVVLIEYPRKGIYSVGFLTNENTTESISQTVNQELSTVFLPTTPSPLTGWIVFVPKKEIIKIDISIEDAIKCLVSGGVINPKSNSMLNHG